MPKRTLCIKNPSKISSKYNNLVIEQKDRLIRIPFEDIWIVILESQHSQITSAALASLAEYDINILHCDRYHMPGSLTLPLIGNSQHTAIIDKQLAAPKPLKKRLWQKIVKSKLINQGKALNILGKDGDEITSMAEHVLSGDPNNKEASGALKYFSSLIHSGGRRSSCYTAGLDYGYAVLRAGIARSVVAGGLLPAKGIHHCSKTNSFNLVDDLIEPFRPVVDLLVIHEDLREPLSSISKTKLASIFEYAVSMPAGKMMVQTAINMEVDTFKASILRNDSSLLQLPTIIPLNKIRFD